MNKKYYQILGISENVTPREITQAYRKLALKWHPDRNRNNLVEATRKMQEINEAYASLLPRAAERVFRTSEKTGSSPTFEEMWERIDRLQREFAEMRQDFDKIGRDLDEQEKRFNSEVAREEVERKKSGYSNSYSSGNFQHPQRGWNYPQTHDRGDDSSSFSTSQNRATLEGKIKFYEECLLKTSSSIEKQKYQQMIAELKGELNKLNSSSANSYDGSQPHSPFIHYDIALSLEEKIRYYENYLHKISSPQEKQRVQRIIGELREEFNKVRDSNNHVFNPVNYQERDNRTPTSNQTNNKLDYKYMSHQELIQELKRKDLENKSLQEIISNLKKKNNELENEITELKKQPESPEIQQEIKQRENWINEVKQSLAQVQNDNNPETNQSEFPTGSILAFMAISLVIMGLVVYKVKKKCKKISIRTSC